MKNVSEVAVFDLCILFYICIKFRDNVSKVFRVICILKFLTEHYIVKIVVGFLRPA